MYKKTISIILALMLLVTTVTAVGSVAVAETADGEQTADSTGFKAGDTVYFDCSACGIQWTSAQAIEYVNLSEYTRADNGGSVIIAERDTARYNPINITEDLGNYQFSYTFTEETAGAQNIRFWRGSTEKMWNNSPLLTYEMFTQGYNCIYASDLEGNGTVGEYGAEPKTEPSSSTEETSSVQSGNNNFKFDYAKANLLYAHGITGNEEDTQAWQLCQNVNGTNYFFLPSSTDENNVELYNTFDIDVTVGSVVIPKGSVVTMAYETGKDYTVSAGSSTYKLKFMRSSAECAVYVNNSGTYGGTDFYDYLCQDKSNSAPASGAVTDKDGNYINTPIKKIKGRGNTSWGKDKKSFNITYDSAQSIAGMDKTKKFSICANYQDDTLSRNRFLYDLGDEVGLPYSPDSRYADFYINGIYMGSYQMCQKIEVGKNQLIGDFTGEEYINADGSFATDFPFALKVDSGVDPGDFTFSAGNNNIIMCAPELEYGDQYYNEVKSYVSDKFTKMFNALKNNSSTLSSLVDIDSCAKIFLINEFGKNWDAGVSSFYFVYKQDKDGNYKFFASPPWDYDNALGNAKGVEWDLHNIGVTDYEEPTGYFVTYKGGRKSTNNVASLMFRNTQLKKRIGEVWYESFVPAIENKFKKTGVNTGEFYSADVYYDLVKNSAEMNYTSGWLLNPEPGWLCDHSSVNVCNFDYTTKAYSQNSTATYYDANTFKGIWDYCIDWTTSRAAWLSNEFAEYYIPVPQPTAPTTEPTTSSSTIATQPTTNHQVGEKTLVEFAFDNTNKIEGDKLTEYGDKSGYKATFGEGDLFLSVDGENGRALEWSAPEYGAEGTDMVPIMAAGSKNMWGAKPYIQVSFDSLGYSDLSFSIDMAGSKKAPANWKMQYSTDGINFTDIQGTDFTISEANRKLMTTYINGVKLPDICNGAEKVTLRLIPTSTTTVAGGDYTETPTSGEIAINYIKIEGESSKQGILGDVNLDGSLNVQDATIIQKSVVKKITLTSLQKKVADFNGDGEINIKDVTAIQKKIAKL